MKAWAGLAVAAGWAMVVPATALAGAFTAELDLSTLNGANGFILDGTGELWGSSGNSVSAAGDVNGDGLADIIVGAPFESHNGIRTGLAYVVFGTDQGFPARWSLTTLDGADGFAIAGVSDGDRTGYTVSGAGDVNGDGVDDIIVEANYADPNGVADAGRRYVVFGTRSGFPAVFDLSTLNGTNGFALNGINPYDAAWVGANVSGAGDINGDGFSDIVIGASWATPYPSSDPYFPGPYDYAGQSYVVFGAADGFPPEVDLAALDGTNGFIVNGYGYGAASGTTVSAAGDVNADGFDDFIIGAPYADSDNYPSAGKVYVIFGTDQGFPAVLELSAIDGVNGFALNGVEPSDGAGYSVSDVGDVNGDGVDDIIIGAPGAGADPAVVSNRSYVVFGSNRGFPAQFELSSLDGSNGFVLLGTGPSSSGGSVSGAGDVNGDGIDDVIVGDFAADVDGKVDVGQSYVVFGSDQGFPDLLNLSSLDGANGFALNGITENGRAGYSVSDAGDVNGDGVGDIIIGTPWGLSADNAPVGQTYVVFGRGGPALTVSGACPGKATISVNRATPGGTLWLLGALAEGDHVISSGDCAGTVLGLDNPLLFFKGVADASGAMAISIPAPAPTCGTFLQAVDVASCVPSNIAQLQ